MPVLVRSMKYSELDIILLKGDVEEVGLFKYMCKEEYGGGGWTTRHKRGQLGTRLYLPLGIVLATSLNVGSLEILQSLK